MPGDGYRPRLRPQSGLPLQRRPQRRDLASWLDDLAKEMMRQAKALSTSGDHACVRESTNCDVRAMVISETRSPVRKYLIRSGLNNGVAALSCSQGYACRLAKNWARMLIWMVISRVRL